MVFELNFSKKLLKINEERSCRKKIISLTTEEKYQIFEKQKYKLTKFWLKRYTNHSNYINKKFTQWIIGTDDGYVTYYAFIKNENKFTIITLNY